MTDTACFDFDGVIHPYGNGYGRVFTHPCDPNVKKTIIELSELGWRVVCHTTRALTEQGRSDVEAYLYEEGLRPYISEITGEKVPARVYVDDRAITYDGKNKNLLRDILTFRSHVET